MNYLRTIILAALVISATATSNAQQWFVGAEGNISIPTGELGKIAKPGVGYGVVSSFGISPTLFVGGSFGIHNFEVGGSSYGKSNSIQAIHMGFTGRYLLQPVPQTGTAGMIPFVAVGVHYNMLSALGEGISLSRSLETGWGVTQQAGVMIPFGDPASDAVYIDPSLMYHTILTEGSSLTMFSLNVGFRAIF